MLFQNLQFSQHLFLQYFKGSNVVCGEERDIHEGWVMLEQEMSVSRMSMMRRK